MSDQLDMFGNQNEEPAIKSWLSMHGAHGVLLPEEVQDVSAGVSEAYELLKDGAWRTRDWIERHHSATEAMRRVRDLRPVLKPLGYEVQRRRRADGARVFEYRIAKIGDEE